MKNDFIIINHPVPMQTINSPKANKPILAKAPGATLQKHIQHICSDTDTCRDQGVQWDTCLGSDQWKTQ